MLYLLSLISMSCVSPCLANLCLYPDRGSSFGSTVVSVSLVDLYRDPFCLTYVFNFSCVFDGIIVNATYHQRTNTIRCKTPTAHIQNSTVAFNIMHNGMYITTNNAFFSYLHPNDTRIKQITSRTPKQHAIALCRSCAAYNSHYCSIDCNGDYFGVAFTDVCSQCVGGNTNVSAGSAKDCAGVCFGRSTIRQIPTTNTQACICDSITSLQCSNIPNINPPPTQSIQYIYTSTAFPSTNWISLPTRNYSLSSHSHHSSHLSSFQSAAPHSSHVHRISLSHNVDSLPLFVVTQRNNMKQFKAM